MRSGGRLIVAVALVAAATLAVPAVVKTRALAAPRTTAGDWVEAGFDAANSHDNASETVLGAANVGQLTGNWNKAAATGSAPIAVGDNVYAWSPTAINSYNRFTGAVQWSFAAPGKLFDVSVAYAGGVVYGASQPDSGTPTLYAINATTGAMLWKQKIASFSGWPLVVADGAVYYTDFARHLVAVDTATHKVKWKFTAHDELTRPAIANGTVYVGSFDHKLYALNEATGAKEWAFNARDEIFASASIANGLVYAGQRSGTMYAVDATTGTLRWKFQSGGTYTTDAAIANGNIYFGSNDNSVYALNATTGKLAWTFATGNVVDVAPVVANGVAYVSSTDKNLYALNASTGAKLLTTFTGVSALENVVVSNGDVFLGLATGHLRRFVLPD